MNRANCNNCRWTDCPIRQFVDQMTHVCDDWEHYAQAVPNCEDNLPEDCE